jgi:hypothetical protein
VEKAGPAKTVRICQGRLLGIILLAKPEKGGLLANA